MPTATQEKETNSKVKRSRRSTRLSGLADKSAAPAVAGDKGRLQCAAQTETSTVSQSRSQSNPTAMETKLSSRSQSAGSESGDEGRPSTKGNPETFVLLNKAPTETSGVRKRIGTRKSLGSSFPLKVTTKSSQVGDQCLQNLQQADETVKRSRVRIRHSLGVLPEVARRTASQEVWNTRVELGQGVCNGVSGEKSSSSDDEGSSALNKQKQGASSTQQKSWKGGGMPETKKGDSTRQSGPLEQPSQTQQVEAGTSKTAGVKTTARKRKLLNPSQEMHVLSCSQADSPNLPKSASGCTEPKKQGKKRKSCDADAVFPSSFPASKRGRRSLQSKENQGTRRLCSQVDPNTSDEASTDPCSSSKENRLKKSRKALHETKKDRSISASALCTTSQTSSVLGSSMSMLFSDTSTSAPVGRKFAPPRNSMADFQVQKPRRQRKLAVPKGERKTGGEQIKAMSLQKFRLTCMPSLVMTSLHRP